MKTITNIKNILVVTGFATFTFGAAIPLHAGVATATENISASRQLGSSIVKFTSKTKELVKKGAVAAQECYFATVKGRAIKRAGNCNNLNGHILEVMGGDQTNLNPTNGLHEKMTVSPNAKTVDATVVKEGKVVQRIQYKDTVNSISETVRKVKSGQYNSVTLKGTTETAEAFNSYAAKHGINKRMQDTGISSDLTKTLAKSCGKVNEYSIAKMATTSAVYGAATGGVIAGGISTVSNISDVKNGKKDIETAAKDVAIDTVGGVLAGGAASVAGALSGSAVATGAAALGITGAAAAGATIVVPVVVATGTAFAVSYCWEKAWNRDDVQEEQ